MYVNASDVGYDDCDVVVGSAMMMTGKTDELAAFGVLSRVVNHIDFIVHVFMSPVFQLGSYWEYNCSFCLILLITNKTSTRHTYLI